jgi:hypothetical protein
MKYGKSPANAGIRQKLFAERAEESLVSTPGTLFKSGLRNLCIYAEVSRRG